MDAGLSPSVFLRKQSDEESVVLHWAAVLPVLLREQSDRSIFSSGTVEKRKILRFAQDDKGDARGDEGILGKIK